MALYKITAVGTTPSATTTRKGRCTAANVRMALLRLFARYPQLEEVESLQVTVSLDDEEDLS